MSDEIDLDAMAARPPDGLVFKDAAIRALVQRCKDLEAESGGAKQAALELVPRLAAQLEIVRAQKITLDTVKRERDAALRAVEAVRVFSTNLPCEEECCISQCDDDECKRYQNGYRDGVEAVQALLEGEK